MGLWGYELFIVSVGGWLLKLIMFRREAGQFDNIRFGRMFLVRDEVAGDHESFFIPPPDFLNDLLGYNFDEDMLLGDKRHAAKWPLLDGIVGQMMDVALDSEKDGKEEDEEEEEEDKVDKSAAISRALTRNSSSCSRSR